jgi:hypothetical protein
MNVRAAAEKVLWRPGRSVLLSWAVLSLQAVHFRVFLLLVCRCPSSSLLGDALPLW